MQMSLKLFRHYMDQKATIHIYSFPNFTLETLLAISILAVYLLLYFDVCNILQRATKIRSNSVFCENSESREEINRDSYCTNLRRRYTEYCTKSIASSVSGFFKRTNDVPEQRRYKKHLMSVTPERFVKMEKRLREKDDLVNSLSTLCKNTISQKYSTETLKRQLERTKENVQLCRAKTQNYTKSRTNSMTNSMFNLLESLISTSSVENPLPFKGDITKLAMEMADLGVDDNRKKFPKIDDDSSESLNYDKITF